MAANPCIMLVSESRHSWVDDVPPDNLATTVRGVFAVGDICAGSMKRVAPASGEGASVVPSVHVWLAGNESGSPVSHVSSDASAGK